MVVATVPFGTFQKYVLQQRGAVWVALAVLAASLLGLAMRRVQLNGFSAAAERVTRSRNSLFLWPALTLPLGMVGYATYLPLTGGDGHSIMLLALYNMLGPLVVMLTRMLNGTAQDNALYWLLCGMCTLGVLAWNMRTIGPSILAVEQAGVPGPEASTMVIVLASTCMLLFGVICLTTA